MMDKSIEKFKKLYNAYQNVIFLSDEIILKGHKEQQILLAYRKARIELSKVKRENSES